MKCQKCQTEVQELVYENKGKPISFNHCPKCHTVLDNMGNPAPKSIRVDSNEEDLLRWLLGGGSNPSSGL